MILTPEIKTIIVHVTHNYYTGCQYVDDSNFQPVGVFININTHYENDTVIYILRMATHERVLVIVGWYSVIHWMLHLHDCGLLCLVIVNRLLDIILYICIHVTVHRRTRTTVITGHATKTYMYMYTSSNTNFTTEQYNNIIVMYTELSVMK